MVQHHRKGVPPGCPLTRRQLECLFIASFGDSCYEVAEQLGCAASTVRSHWNGAFRTLKAKSLRHAILIANEADWWDPKDPKPKGPPGFELSVFARAYLEGFGRSIGDEDEAGLRRRTAALHAMVIDTGADVKLDRTSSIDPMVRLLRAIADA